MKTISTCVLAFVILPHALFAAEPIVSVGAGSYATALPQGAKEPPATIYKTENITGPVPTNRWWSSVAWAPFSDRQFPHPLAVQCQAGGLRVAYPGKVTAGEKGFSASMPGGNDDLILGHSSVAEFPDARLDGSSDWFVRVRFASAERSMTVSYGHGCPYVYATFVGGSAKIAFAQPIKIWAGKRGSATLGVTINGNHYGLFAPGGSTWTAPDAKTLVVHSEGKPYFSLAVLPEAAQEALDLFAHHAHNHVTDTQVEWHYLREKSEVQTTFRFETKPQEEGQSPGTLFALYPHQWKHARQKLLPYQYGCVRGTMKLGQGDRFTTAMSYHGVLPGLPTLGTADRKTLDGLLDAEQQDAGPFRDTYWEGKWLGRRAGVVSIAELTGNKPAAQRLLASLRGRLEQWFTAAEHGKAKSAGLFYYNRAWGTLIGYPAGYGSDTDLNDHHFHYGYYVRAAAEVTRHDPGWAAAERWGGMLDLVVRDIASPRRDDPQFPFLRNFDPYAGHSWASGPAKFADGNNQESSSEAMNAWYGLILLGETTGNDALRDLGIYLYATELAAINAYWFDLDHENFPPGYPQPTVGMVWGGKADYATWFSGKPEHIHGINWLPIHAGSLYLGLDPKYVRRNYEALLANRRERGSLDWADLVWMYCALDDPEDALRQYNARPKGFQPEAGNSPAALDHWLHALATLGHVDASVTADCPLYAVFLKGDRRTYAVYNAGAAPLAVRFSDGHALTAPPGQFTVEPNPKQ